MTTKTNGDLAANVRLLRKQKGLTQVELAQRIGCSQAVITAYEKGRKKPSIDTLARLAEVLGASTDQIVGKRAVPNTKRPAKNPKLWKKFSQLEQLPNTDKRTVFRMIEGLLTQRNRSKD